MFRHQARQSMERMERLVHNGDAQMHRSSEMLQELRAERARWDEERRELASLKQSMHTGVEHSKLIDDMQAQLAQALQREEERSRALAAAALVMA